MSDASCSIFRLVAGTITLNAVPSEGVFPLSPGDDRLSGCLGTTRAHRHTASSCGDAWSSTDAGPSYAGPSYADTYIGATDTAPTYRGPDATTHPGTDACADIAAVPTTTDA